MDRIAPATAAVLSALPDIKYLVNEPLKNHTSFRIGGPVRVMFFPESVKTLTENYQILSEHKVTPLILGNGTNILASDSPLDKVVIRTTELRGCIRTGENEITAEAGAPLRKISELARDCGLAGFEFAHGIPGALGGAVLMNAGAYGGEMKDVIHSTTAYDYENGEFTITGADHDFSYRHSRFSDTRCVILSSKIKLREGSAEEIGTMIDELTARRRKTQPLDASSAGSVFKRPKEGYAAALIELAGLRGLTVGGAQVSEKHAGFIINRGDATFSDVTTLIDKVRETVSMFFNVELEPEIRIITNAD